MTQSKMQKHQILSSLPPEWPDSLTTPIRDSLIASQKTIVVLDDDPTGTQTVHDVDVLARYDAASIENVLKEGPPVLFLLTNSRSMTSARTKDFHNDLVAKLKRAASESGREIEIISRSDSTLRGHFPVETDVLTEAWPEQAELCLLMPFFLEGGRLTIAGQHYVSEGDELVPAHETPFAQDSVFGFNHSCMPDYVEEKTQGRVKAGEVVVIPIDVIRRGPAAVLELLNGAPQGSVCVADGVVDSDAQVIAAAVGLSPRKILARVAASYVRARAGLERRELLSEKDLKGDAGGGLTIVGSHVPKSTAQLKRLVGSQSDMVSVEISIADVLESPQKIVDNISREIDVALEKNRDVVLFTSRDVVRGKSDEENLRISKSVSSCLVEIIKQISIRPKYLVAKGGITSSDIATEGLGVQRAKVVGSIYPGVPVWKLGDEAKFPGLHYVIFPGNVGGDDALNEVVTKLKS